MTEPTNYSQCMERPLPDMTTPTVTVITRHDITNQLFAMYGNHDGMNQLPLMTVTLIARPDCTTNYQP